MHVVAGGGTTGDTGVGGLGLTLLSILVCGGWEWDQCGSGASEWDYWGSVA